MFTSSWIPWRLARQHKGRPRPSQSPALRRRGTRPTCEQLEDRTVPSSFTAATVEQLIGDIEQANALAASSSTPIQNTITLTPHKTFTLTAVDNTTDSANGLPV